MCYKIQKNIFWFHTRVLWSPFPLQWKPNIFLVNYGSWWQHQTNSGMTSQEGGFQNPGVCLQAFPSLLPHPLPALLLRPFFARCLTLVPRFLLLNRTETLATQAIIFLDFHSTKHGQPLADSWSHVLDWNQMFPDRNTLSNVPRSGYITTRDQSMVESGVREGKTLPVFFFVN